MRHDEAHWERVAKFYTSAKVTKKELVGGKSEHTVRVEKVQNRFPDVTVGTVSKWIRTCRVKGLIQ